VAGEAGFHQFLVSGFAVGKVTETPPASGEIFLRVLDHESHVQTWAGNEGLDAGAGEAFSQNFIIVLRRDLVPVERGNDSSVGKGKFAFLISFNRYVVT
jgi:hypothetical protein